MRRARASPIPQFAGAHWDLCAAVILCQPDRVDYSFINGRRVVNGGRLATADLESLVARLNAAARALAARAQA